MWLRVLSGADAGRVVEVAADAGRPFVLGRVRGSDLVVRDARASRRHVALTPGPHGGLHLEDLGSANGTWVDGEAVREALLAGGEVLEVGGVRIAVLATEPETAAAAPAAPPAEPIAAPAGVTAEHRGVAGAGRLGRFPPLAVAAAGVLAGAAAVLAATGVLDGGEERAPAVIRAAAPATVMVEARRDGAPSGRGSGWVPEPGLVVTAAHVVNEGESFAVSNGSRRSMASVLAAAPCEDLAVLQAPGWGGDARLGLGTDADVEQGETVFALGYPTGSGPGEEASSTRGVVSAARASFRDPAPDVPAYPEAIRTDTALDPGFSGGPLVDLDRRVVGVNAAARTTGDDGRPLQGANFAIAPDRARRVLTDLRAGRSRGWIGASFGYPSTEELAGRRLPEGLYLLGAVAGSPAAIAGLGGAGELLTAVDGRAVGRTLQGWCRATRGIGSGERAELSVLDADGVERTVTLRFA